MNNEQCTHDCPIDIDEGGWVYCNTHSRLPADPSESGPTLSVRGGSYLASLRQFKNLDLEKLINDRLNKSSAAL